MSLAAIVTYCGGAVGASYLLEREVYHQLQKRNEQLPSWTFKKVLATFVMVPVTQFVYMSTIIRLLFLRRVEWRGVEYEIRPDKSVRLIEYKPYHKKSATEDETYSL
ncbi:MAG: hypothetical protein LBK82_03625 [Planctomycetaceae bacterium]|nr:hypothetical protein [Planctomycetaceae bacterium]